MNLVIATPIRDRAWALPSWWTHVVAASSNAVRSGDDIQFLFLENDSVDGTLEKLQEIGEDDPDVRVLKHDFGYAHYRAPRGSDPVNTKNDKSELAQLRNMLVDAFLETDADYLVMWDSDVWMPLDAISAHPRSLVSVMEAHPEIGTLCADVQHPHCGGRYHNGMVLNSLGQLNHPDRTRSIPPNAALDVWCEKKGALFRPQRSLLLCWDQRAARYSDLIPETLYLAEVATTGGGGAAILRRSVFEEPIGARYAAHILGEDVNLCRTIHNAGQKVALYSGIRGLHLSRKLFDEVGGEIGLEPEEPDLPSPYISGKTLFGVWVEDWKRERRCAQSIS